MWDFPMEFLQSHSDLPVGQESMVKFTLQSKHEMYTKWEDALFRDAGDPMRSAIRRIIHSPRTRTDYADGIFQAASPA
jgi:hypothetical protein